MGGPTRLRTPSVRSAASNSTSNSTSNAASVRSASSASSVRSISSISSVRSASTARSTESAQSQIQSIASLLSSVARAARHAPLESAAQALRASLSASPSVALSHAGSVASGRSASTSRGSIRAGSVRSVATSASRTSTLTRETTASEAAARAKEEEEALAQLHTLATSPVRCANPGCGTLIPAAGLDDITFPTPFTAPTPANPYALPPPLLAALHARCPVCTTAHCRGCGLPTGCDGCAEQPATAGSPWPSPSKSWSAPPPPTSKANRCPIPTHCPAARALGVLAALVAFDRAYLASLASKPGRATDKPLLGALHALVYLLETPPPRLRLHPSPAAAPPGSFPSAPSGSSASSSSRSLRSVSSTGAGLLLRAQPQSWDGGSVSSYGGGSESSYGGGSAVRCGLLRAGAAPPVDVGTWMARAPAYGAVLGVLKALGGEGGCAEVLVWSVQAMPVSGQGGGGAGGGVEAWLRASPAQNRRWERERERERERAERERLRNAARGGVGAERQEDGVSLLSLIRTLEPARLALLRLAGATRFGPTVETAHALCDGVLYLLLHDLLEA
ncbi:hypothetical protein B0H14DRAFT_2846836 [Mycena olivaceomarginata]|nr:hypothetical protein B0H14DRAFT_2846836 [Mycena olivaceomarginata]